jgi:hypothetical protein
MVFWLVRGGDVMKSFEVSEAFVELRVVVGIVRFKRGDAGRGGEGLRIRRRRLEVSHVSREVANSGGVRGLQRVDAANGRRRALRDAPLQAVEAPGPTLILLIKTAIELSELVEQHLHVRFHCSPRSLKTCIVVVAGGIQDEPEAVGGRNWIGSRSLIP